jgi:hypothetical protein
VWSAYGSGSFALATCAVTREPGSSASRAAPALAGAAALLREFVMSAGDDGWFAQQSPVGYAASSYSASAPSAALVKALLIGSTTALAYGYDLDGDEVGCQAFEREVQGREPEWSAGKRKIFMSQRSASSFMLMHFALTSLFETHEG